MHPDVQSGRFKTGAIASPRYVLANAVPYQVPAWLAPPPQVAYVPKQLDMWGNDQYGDCVSAEEAFAKACYQPEIFIPAAVVTQWASRRGFLNGADLPSVMDAMKSDGFVVGSQKFDDGPRLTVDYSNEMVLQSALSQGPVKIAIDHSALPNSAGNQNGWYSVGGRPGQYGNTDHCVGLAGYGLAAWLYSQLGVPLPAALSQGGYLLFTWSTLGFVDHAWIMSTCAEAWLRNPTTVGVPPLTPQPTPTPTPPPPTPPAPGPTPSGLAITLGNGVWSPGTYNVLSADDVAALQDAAARIDAAFPPPGRRLK